MPPAAPMTATAVLLLEEVDSCRPRAEIGRWNLENILEENQRSFTELLMFVETKDVLR